MLVTVGSETRRLAVTGRRRRHPDAARGADRAAIRCSPLLARAATPIAVRVGDAPPLILPPSPMIGTYIGQCASGAAAARPAAAGNSAAPANAARRRRMNVARRRAR